MIDAPQIALTHQFPKALLDIIRMSNSSRIFIVTGRNLINLTGAKEELEKILEGLDVEYFFYSSPNPTIEDIQESVNNCRSHRSQIIIGLGGGTAMDIAKATRAFVANPENPRETVINKTPFQKASQQILIQIPTTSGTGSEITPFAVVYIDGTKYSLDDPLLKADHFLLVPQFTMSMPTKLTAVTVFDALSQAIESFWSVKSSHQSELSSEESIQRIVLLLDKLSEDLTLEDRASLLEASHFSGLAIAQTRTTAAHAISYSLTSKFDIPHGLAVFLTLPGFLLYNYEVDDFSIQDSRGIDFVRAQLERIAKCLGRETVVDASEWFTEVMEQYGFSTRLRNYGISEDDIRTIIVPSFNEERGKNNPRRVTKDDLTKMLLEIW